MMPKKSEVSCSDRLKVLADPTRLRVVQELMVGPRHVAEINEAVRIEQSLLSHHLRVLRDSQLVLAERDGKAVLYRLAPEVSVEEDARAISLGCCVLSFEPVDRDGMAE